MEVEKFLIRLTAIFFMAYGALFTLFPVLFSDMVMGSVPATTSGLIDMRATYGGLSVALGVLMFSLAMNQTTLRLGLFAVFVVLLGMALARTLGIIVDGSPNRLMYIYLAAEIVPSIVALVLHQRMRGSV